MSQDNFFRTAEEELARLNKELTETRELLRDAVARLSTIERHVKRAFGVKATPNLSREKAKTAGTEQPSISPEEALDVFRELTELWRDREISTVEGRLERMSLVDLKLMAHELGVSFPSKPARRNLHAGIRGRISESVMLSRNQNVTAPRSQTLEQSGDSETEEPIKTTNE
jgi:hypothetical protein